MKKEYCIKSRFNVKKEYCGSYREAVSMAKAQALECQHRDGPVTIYTYVDGGQGPYQAVYEIQPRASRGTVLIAPKHRIWR